MLAMLDATCFLERAGDCLVWLIDASVKSAVVLAAALALAGALRRAEARVRHALLSAALLGVLVVPVLSQIIPSWRLSLLPSLTVSRSESMAATAPKHSAYPQCARETAAIDVRHPKPPLDGSAQPAQPPPRGTLGFSMAKPRPIGPSWKSIVVPSRCKAIFFRVTSERPC